MIDIVLIFSNLVFTSQQDVPYQLQMCGKQATMDISFLALDLGVSLTVPLFKTGLLSDTEKVLGLVWIL